MSHESPINSIRDGLREQYRHKIIDESLQDDMNQVAFVMIDLLLEMMTEMLKEYDQELWNQLNAET